MKAAVYTGYGPPDVAVHKGKPYISRILFGFDYFTVNLKVTS